MHLDCSHRFFRLGLMTSNLGSRLPFLMYQRFVSTQAVIHFRCFPHFNSTRLTSGNSNKQLLWSFVSSICGESSRGIYPLAAFSLYSALPPSFAVSSSVQGQPMDLWRLGTKKAANVGERRLAFSHCLWAFGRATTLATTRWMFWMFLWPPRPCSAAARALALYLQRQFPQAWLQKGCKKWNLVPSLKGCQMVILDW